jgi:hypothetical protein
MKQIDPRSVIQIASDRYPAPFHTFRFGKIKPFTGGCRDGQLDLFYYRNPELQEGEPFPLWMILEATNITLALGEREYKTPSRAILKEKWLFSSMSPLLDALLTLVGRHLATHACS